MISLKEIEKLATLARIQLSDEEKKKLQKDVGAILLYVSQINLFSPTDKNAATGKYLLVNVMREDTTPHTSGIFTETLLSAAPVREGQYIKVKKIL